MIKAESLETVRYGRNWRTCQRLCGSAFKSHGGSTKYNCSHSTGVLLPSPNIAGVSSMTATSEERLDILVQRFYIMSALKQNVKGNGTFKKEKSYNRTTCSSATNKDRVSLDRGSTGTGKSRSCGSGQSSRGYNKDEDDEDDKDNKQKENANSKETSTEYVFPDEEDLEVARTADVLADIFPAIPRSQLLARAMSCKNVDLIVEELFAEMGDKASHASQSHHFPDDVFVVKDMFPDRNLADIDCALRQHGRNIEETITVLLQNRSETAASTNVTQPSTDSSPAGSNANTWSALQLNVERIEDLLHVPPLVARGYLHRHNGRIYPAIVDIISTYRCTATNLPQPSKRRLGGRVQGQSTSAGMSKSGIPSSLLTLQSPSKGSGEPADGSAGNSAASAELTELYNSSSELRIVCKDFLDKALEFFNGSIDSVLQISSLLIESNSAALTFPSRSTTASLLRVSRLHIMPTLSYSTLHADTVARQLSPASVLSNNDRLSPTVNTRLSTAYETNTLDLHNLNVPDALDAASRALSAWWDEELTQRKSQGKLLSYGFSSVFVLPLIIISGRGIHSKDGKSPIKVAIRKYLAKHGYIYEESSAKFEVRGKRS